MTIKTILHSYPRYYKKRRNKFKDCNKKILNIGFKLTVFKEYTIKKNKVKVIRMDKLKKSL